jgi:hypothetical protein
VSCDSSLPPRAIAHPGQLRRSNDCCSRVGAGRQRQPRAHPLGRLGDLHVRDAALQGPGGWQRGCESSCGCALLRCSSQSTIQGSRSAVTAWRQLIASVGGLQQRHWVARPQRVRGMTQRVRRCVAGGPRPDDRLGRPLVTLSISLLPLCFPNCHYPSKSPPAKACGKIRQTCRTSRTYSMSTNRR